MKIEKIKIQDLQDRERRIQDPQDLMTELTLKIQDAQDPTMKSQELEPTETDSKNYKIQVAVLMKIIQNPGNINLSIY